MATLIHLLCWKLFRTTFSSDLEEAMTESGKSLSNSKIYCSVLEKILDIYDVKQNEKHPLILKFSILLRIDVFYGLLFI